MSSRKLCLLAVGVGAVAMAMIHALPMTAITGSATAAVATESGMNPTSMNVLSQSDLELTMQFVDAAAQTITIEFQRSDVDSPWLAVNPVQSERGIAFGHQSPRMPTLTNLRNRDIDPALVVKPFEAGFYTGPMDDLTIYQLGGDSDQLAIAVHSDDLIVSIGYVGHLAHMAFQPAPPQRVCTLLLFACCNNNDEVSCGNVIKWCSLEQAGDACSCLLANCESEPPDIDACNKWLTCCWGNECDPPPPEPEPDDETALDSLTKTTLDLLQYHLDTL